MLPGTLSLLQDKVNRACGGCLSVESLLQGGIKLCCAVLSEQPAQMSGEKGDRLTSGKGCLDEGVDGRNDTTQTSDNCGTGRLALLLHQLLNMAWIINPGVAVITAWMSGNLAHPVKQANLILTGNQSQLLSNRCGWNGVVVQIVPDIDRLV